MSSAGDSDSGYGTLDSSNKRMIDFVDFQRLERKLDRMASSLEKLVIIEERQTNQKTELAKQETLINALRESHEKLISLNKDEIDKLREKVDQWINRTIGGGFVISTLFAIVTWIWK